MKDRIILRIVDDVSVLFARQDAHGIIKVEESSWDDLPSDVKEDAHLIFIPTMNVLVTEAHLPKIAKSKLHQAIPFALEDELIDSPEELCFVFDETSPGNNLPVAVINRQLLQKWVEQYEEQDCHIKEMQADGFGLPYEPTHWHLFIDKQYALLRTGQFSVQSLPINNIEIFLSLALKEKTALKKIIIDYDESHKNFDRTLLNNLPATLEWAEHPKSFFDLAFTQVTKLPSLNLLNDNLSTTSGRKVNSAWKKTGILALTFCAIWLLSQLTQLGMLSWRNYQLEKQVKHLYFSVFPSSSSFVDPRLRIERELSSSDGNTAGGEFLNILILVGEQLSASANAITINQLHYSNRSLVLEVSAPSFENLTEFTQAIQKRSLSIEQTNAKEEKTEVTATMTIRSK